MKAGIELDLIAGVGFAATSSALYNVAAVLQAGEARTTELVHQYRLSLLNQLAGRPRWLGGVALSFVGWLGEATAFTLAPITVVQPTLAFGLLLLLGVGGRALGERVALIDVVSCLTIIAGVAGLTSVAPPHSSHHPHGLMFVVSMSVLTMCALLPFVWFKVTRRRAGYVAALGCGFSYALGSLATKFATDDLAAGLTASTAAWLLGAAAIGLIGMLSEMTALQTRPATRVVPMVFVLHMLAPVMLAPTLGGEHWSTRPLAVLILLGSLGLVAFGAVTLTSRRAVAGRLRQSLTAEATH
jgi:hypothetical protein